MFEVIKFIQYVKYIIKKYKIKIGKFFGSVDKKDSS